MLGTSSFAISMGTVDYLVFTQPGLHSLPAPLLPSPLSYRKFLSQHHLFCEIKVP